MVGVVGSNPIVPTKLLVICLRKSVSAIRLPKVNLTGI